MLEKLLILQDRDSRLSRLAEELHRIPLDHAELDRQLQAAADAADQAKNESRRIEADRKKLEVDAETKGALVRKYKGQLLEIKNNDQFHALQHEITAAEQEIRKTEYVELVCMEKYEIAQATSKAAESKHKEIIRHAEMQRNDLQRRQEVMDRDVKSLQEERNRLAAEVDEDVLGHYDRIYRSKHGNAIAAISHGLCSGCHLKLTSQEIHHAQHNEQLVTCTNCGRILYWVPE